MKYRISATLPSQEAMTQMVIYLAQLEGISFSVVDAEGEPDLPTVTAIEEAGPTRPLRQIILQAAKAKGGVTRAKLVTLAKRAGHKPTSVSPQLNQLVAAKKLKKIGDGLYRATAPVGRPPKAPEQEAAATVPPVALAT